MPPRVRAASSPPDRLRAGPDYRLQQDRAAQRARFRMSASAAADVGVGGGFQHPVAPCADLIRRDVAPAERCIGIALLKLASHSMGRVTACTSHAGSTNPGEADQGDHRDRNRVAGEQADHRGRPGDQDACSPGRCWAATWDKVGAPGESAGRPRGPGSRGPTSWAATATAVSDLPAKLSGERRTAFA